LAPALLQFCSSLSLTLPDSAGTALTLCVQISTCVLAVRGFPALVLVVDAPPEVLPPDALVLVVDAPPVLLAPDAPPVLPPPDAPPLWLLDVVVVVVLVVELPELPQAASSAPPRSATTRLMDSFRIK